jgi:hypothetical protein
MLPKFSSFLMGKRAKSPGPKPAVTEGNIRDLTEKSLRLDQLRLYSATQIDLSLVRTNIGKKPPSARTSAELAELGEWDGSARSALYLGVAGGSLVQSMGKPDGYGTPDGT